VVFFFNEVQYVSGESFAFRSRPNRRITASASTSFADGKNPDGGARLPEIGDTSRDVLLESDLAVADSTDARRWRREFVVRRRGAENAREVRGRTM
jgi:hypothetical protein